MNGLGSCSHVAFSLVHGPSQTKDNRNFKKKAFCERNAFSVLINIIYTLVQRNQGQL